MTTVEILEAMQANTKNAVVLQGLEQELKKARLNPKPVAVHTLTMNQNSERFTTNENEGDGDGSAYPDFGGLVTPEFENSAGDYRSKFGRKRAPMPYQNTRMFRQPEGKKILGVGYNEDANPETAREIFRVLSEAGAMARTSALAGTICEDGNMFNPYIHRTFLPLIVLNVLGQMRKNARLNSRLSEADVTRYAFDRYCFILAMFGGMPPVSNLGNFAKLRCPVDGMLVGWKSPWEADIDDEAECRRLTKENQKLKRESIQLRRFWVKVRKTIEREAEIVDNMARNGTADHITERFGVPAAKLPQLSKYPGGDMARHETYMESRDVWHGSHETINVWEEPDTHMYAWLGLYSTWKSVKNFPQRYVVALGSNGQAIVDKIRDIDVDSQIRYKMEPDGRTVLAPEESAIVLLDAMLAAWE